MSEKLLKGFKAVSWNYINWFMTRKCVSRLQARIYSTALKQEYGKMRRLQKKLLNAPYSKLLSIFTVLQYANFSVLKRCKITQQEKSNLGQCLTIQQPVDKIYASGFLRSDISRNMRQILYNIIQQSQRVLAELAIKPEWKAKCFKGFYPFILTARNSQSVFTILIQKLRKSQEMCVLSLDFSVYSNYVDCLPILNTMRLTTLFKVAIKRWLNNLTQLSQASNSLKCLWNLAPIRKCIWPVQIAMYLFVHALLIWLGKENISVSFTCIKHNSQLLFMHSSTTLLQEIAHFIDNWLVLTNSSTEMIKKHLWNLKDGFEFQGCRIQKKGMKQNIIIIPSPKSRGLLTQYLTKIIKRSKHLSAYQLICRLSAVITYWGMYFEFTQCRKTFRYLDHVIYVKLWLWALKQHSMWSKNKVRQKYFLENKQCLYRNQLISSNYSFYHTLESSTGSNIKYFLIRFIWFKPTQKSRSMN